MRPRTPASPNPPILPSGFLLHLQVGMCGGALGARLLLCPLLSLALSRHRFMSGSSTAMAGSKGIPQSANVYLVLSTWSLGLRGEGTRAGINRKTKGINVKVQSWSSSRAAEGPRNVLELPYRDPPCASYGDLETSPRPGTEEEWGPFRPVLCPGLRHVAFGRFGVVLG